MTWTENHPSKAAQGGDTKAAPPWVPHPDAAGPRLGKEPAPENTQEDSAWSLAMPRETESP